MLDIFAEKWAEGAVYDGVVKPSDTTRVRVLRMRRDNPAVLEDIPDSDDVLVRYVVKNDEVGAGVGQDTGVGCISGAHREVSDLVEELFGGLNVEAEIPPVAECLILISPAERQRVAGGGHDDEAVALATREAEEDTDS